MKNKFSIAMSLAMIVAVLVTSFALADDVAYDVNATVDFTSLTAGGATKTVDLYIVPQINDGKNGCNLTGSTILKVDVVSSDTNVATVSPAEITFTNCEVVLENLATAVTVTPLSVGSATISLSLDTNTTAGTFNLAPATFTAIVGAPVVTDSTPPVITPNISGTLGNNGWYVSDVTLTWTVTDPESTVTIDDGCEDQNITADQFATDYSCSASSDGGSTGPVTVSIKRDATAPVLSLAFTPDSPDGTNGWWKTPGGVPFAWTCNDATSGIDNSFDGGCPSSMLGTVTAQGTTNFADQVKDLAGNLSVAINRDLMLDNIAPSIVAALTPASPAVSGWYNLSTGAPIVSFTCSDGGSGLAANACPASYTFGEGASQSYSANVSDLAGNSASDGVSGVNVDLTAPSITITSPANGASFLLNQPVAAAFGCTDSGSSGLATCVGTVANGSNIDTASAGSKSFSVNASDVAGNTSSATNGYTVAYKVCALYDQTKSHKAGSTVPLKLQLCDFSGANVSSASIVVKAISVTKLDNSASGILDDSGAANSPDMNFRYDATLGGSGGYIFNLSTKGLTTGTWKVTFTVDGQGSYFVKFDVK